MLDNKLHKTREWIQTLALPDGETVLVRKFEIRTLLSSRELMPVFQRPDAAGRRGRRVIMPFFEYDPYTQFIKGEEGEKTTLDERMIAIVKAVRENGFDDVPSDKVALTPGAFVHFHFFFAGSEQHAMAWLPDFDEMEWWFMVRAEIVPA